MKKTLYATALCSLMIVGCENEITFRGEETAPQMVLNALLVDGTAVRASLTNSVFFLSDDKIEDIVDGDVRLYVDDLFVEKLEATRITPTGYEGDPSEAPRAVTRMSPPIVNYEPYFVYQGKYVPKRGDRIRIEATAPGFEGKAWAEETVPPAPAVTKIDYSVIDNNRDKPQTIRLKIHLADPAGQRNFYSLKVMALVHCINSDGGKYEMVLDVEYSDPVFADKQLIFDDGDSNEKIFTDDLFNGNDDYALTVSCPFVVRYDGEIDFGYQVELDPMSESYYNFLATIDRYNSNDFLSEPVRVYNNVIGGIGVVAAYSRWEQKHNYYFDMIYSGE